MRLQIAFMTGRSQPGCTALSPDQRAFLDALGAEGRGLTVNFPWSGEDQPWRATPLLTASVNNARDYLLSRQLAFTRQYRPAALNMLDAASQTLLLCGSCGLELFNNLQLPAACLSRVSLFACGPVARRRPSCRHLLVQGRKDWISRFWFTDVDEYIDCGHMNYFSHPALVDICRRFIRTI